MNASATLWLRRFRLTHGWFMSAANRIRIGLVIAVTFMAAGCGRGTPAPLGVTNNQAPQLIQLPANIRPLLPDRSAEDADAETGSIRVQYQQPQYQQAQPPTDSRTEYNVDLATPPQSPGASAVREPLTTPPAGNEAPSAPPMRSQFIPISMPQPSSAPAVAAVPALPASATFVAAAPVSDGPQLTAPVAVDSMAPDIRQAGPQAPPPQSVQSPPERWTSAPITPAALPQSRRRQASSAPSAADPQIAVFESPVTSHQPPLTPQQSPAPGPLQPIAQRALQMAEHASLMAQRGMFFSARCELLQSLQLIAQALDVQEGNGHHAAALAAGLTALEEARDFAISSNRPGNAVNGSGIAANHRTPLLHEGGPAPISPVIAQQQYFGYAQSQFVLATGSVPAASPILYRLGRLQTAMAAHDADPLALHAPQSIVFHQAALATDGGNWLAANELGVLYARYGQLAEARQLLVYSVSVHPHVDGWHNLAVVHRRLGETDLAERAEVERLQLAQKVTKSAPGIGDTVRWVDPKTFAVGGSDDVQAPAERRYAVAPAAASTPTRR